MPTATMVFLIFAVYAVAMFAIGSRALRRKESFQDSIVGSRQSSAFMLAANCIAGQIGSGFVIGGAEYGACYGVGGVWYGVACGLSCLTTILMCKFISTNGYISLSDYLIARYKEKTISLIYSTTTILCGIALLSGQLLAARSVLSTLGLPERFGIVIIAAAALIYANISGLWGLMRISGLQAIIILLGMLAAISRMLLKPGIVFLTQALPAAHFVLIPFGSEMLVSMTLPVILLSPVSQYAFQSVASAKSYRTAQKGYLISFIYLLPIAVVPPLLGMFGHALFPQLTEKQVFTTLLLTELPAPIAALILSAIICAIFISCNSSYIVISTNFVYSIYKGYIAPKADDHACKRIMLVLDIFAFGIGTFLALEMDDIIQILSMGYSVVVAGCLVPFLGGVFWKKGTAAGALAAACAGIVSSLCDALSLIRLPYACIASVLISAVFYVVVSFLTSKRQPETYNHILS